MHLAYLPRLHQGELVNQCDVLSTASEWGPILEGLGWLLEIFAQHHP